MDFVVYGPDSFTALEVKRSRQVHSGDLQGLKAFQADYPEARVALLYLGQEPLRIDGSSASPAELSCRGSIRCSRCRCPDQGVSSQI